MPWTIKLTHGEQHGMSTRTCVHKDPLDLVCNTLAVRLGVRDRGLNWILDAVVGQRVEKNVF